MQSDNGPEDVVGQRARRHTVRPDSGSAHGASRRSCGEACHASQRTVIPSPTAGQTQAPHTVYLTRVEYQFRHFPRTER